MLQIREYRHSTPKWSCSCWSDWNNKTTNEWTPVYFFSLTITIARDKPYAYAQKPIRTLIQCIRICNTIIFVLKCFYWMNSLNCSIHIEGMGIGWENLMRNACKYNILFENETFLRIRYSLVSSIYQWLFIKYLLCVQKNSATPCRLQATDFAARIDVAATASALHKSISKFRLQFNE